ncbi:hypothetical protein ABQ179_002385 [Xanthomonas dyei]|uniref:hypothetical protein n=1 Tax=Xanthomonas dyei TaxID=743699 RepID=UPI0032E95A3E
MYRQLLTGVVGLSLMLVASAVCADPLSDALSAAGKQEFSSTLRVFVLMTMLSFIPVILIGMTCFTRIIVVLALLRHALGIPQTPPKEPLNKARQMRDTTRLVLRNHPCN